MAWGGIEVDELLMVRYCLIKESLGEQSKNLKLAKKSDAISKYLQKIDRELVKISNEVASE